MASVRYSTAVAQSMSATTALTTMESGISTAQQEVTSTSSPLGLGRRPVTPDVAQSGISTSQQVMTSTSTTLSLERGYDTSLSNSDNDVMDHMSVLPDSPLYTEI